MVKSQRMRPLLLPGALAALTLPLLAPSAPSTGVCSLNGDSAAPQRREAEPTIAEVYVKPAQSVAGVLAFLLVTVAASQGLAPTPLPTNHPLLGTWRIDLSNDCFEEYTLRADGTKLSVSGQERNESAFEISPTPSSAGFYRWTDEITKGNGKPDCGGSITQLRHVAVNFVRLYPSGKKFLLCEAENMKSCFAEFYRKGSDA
jgi:hypothetical protein